MDTEFEFSITPDDFFEAPKFSLVSRASYEWKGKKHRLLDVFSDHLEETLRYINEKKIDMISISRGYGYKLKDIDFILNIKRLKGIYVYDIGDTDISAISKCTSLEYVHLSDVSQKLDLSTLPNLCVLTIAWYPGIQLPSTESGKNLQELYLWQFRGKTFDSVPVYENLEHMFVCHGSLQSLSGLERFKNLKIYEHHYGKQLRNISAVAKLPMLEELRFEHCKNIEVENIFEQCKVLKRLYYIACPNLPSLHFLRKMKMIEGFRFCDINVLDGDMTPLLNMNDFAFYPNKRHYSHTEEELKRLQKRD
jgi:hypothetical protein